MVDQFIVKAAGDSSRLEFSGPIPRDVGPDDGFVFKAQLVGGPVTAAVRVYDSYPRRWTDFFRKLSQEWRGWEGVRVIESLEAHIRLEASMDSLGHVRVKTILRGIDVGDEWRAESRIDLEAGQLEDLAHRAEQYFG